MSFQTDEDFGRDVVEWVKPVLLKEYPGCRLWDWQNDGDYQARHIDLEIGGVTFDVKGERPNRKNVCVEIDSNDGLKRSWLFGEAHWIVTTYRDDPEKRVFFFKRHKMLEWVYDDRFEKTLITLTPSKQAQQKNVTTMYTPELYGMIDYCEGFVRYR